MKRRYLRPCIEKTLIAITTLLFMFFAMLNDFELEAIPTLLVLLAILVFNIYILSRYGRGLWLEEVKEEKVND